ncbi:hypothetical protein WJX72_002072 [[Myrmecia] bisecta]|uniref:Double-strand-break repair protein rad21 n=1 Tax=[Myrmecia] bisecta TaxID=41462 RepID=A0AAW1PVQ6_9CHLO
MFYSNELLGKKSPLGAIWIAAHGKKLNRGKVLGVNIVETCKQILTPDVPHALRLQGILIGGVVIIFSKQQMYLLDDCNDMLRKLRSMDVREPAGNTVLEKGREKARMEVITVPDMNALFNGDLDLAGLNLIATQQPRSTLGDDLFLMPTMPEEPEEPAPRAITSGIGGGLMDDMLAFGNGLHMDAMDQEETFEMPDMDMMDMQLDQFPMEEPLLPEPEPMDWLPAEPEQAGAPAAQADEQPQEKSEGEEGDRERENEARPATPEVTQEEVVAVVRQARRGGRKRKAADLVDEPEDILISGKVFRSWMLDHSDIMVDRPQRRVATSRPDLELLGLPGMVATGMGDWCPALLKLWKRSLARAPAKPAQVAAAEGQPVGGVQGHAQAGAEDGHGGVDGQLDMMEADQGMYEAPLEEMDLETERLRAALDTPNGSGDHLKQLQMGLTPGSSGQRLGLSAARPKRRPSSGLHLDANGDRLSDKSSPRRLSDVLEDGVMPEMEGRLDDLLPPQDDNFLADGDDIPAHHGTEGLTQFKLLEASGPSQKEVEDRMNKSTLAMISLLRQTFQRAEDTCPNDEEPKVSLFEMSSRLNRAQAAKLFYQVCVTHTAGFIQAAQDAPYEDIIITKGVHI